MTEPFRLRQAVNVPDEIERNRLVERMRKIRADAVLDKDSAAHWNATHPNETPLDVTFWDEVIAWCDGRGPLPENR